MGKSFVIAFLLCFSLGLSAQDSLCVFKVNGSAYSKLNGKLTPITKGAFISSTSSVIVNKSSKITAINSKGEAFQLGQSGEYSFKKILEHKALENEKSLTSKYFKLIWDELLVENSEKTTIGGVFRGDVLMKFPLDSAKIASSKVVFKWQIEPNIAHYYLFIRNIKTDEISKMATNGSELILYKNLALFANGDHFEWAISTSEFPNLKNIPFYTVTFIEREDYETLKLNYKVLIKDLKALGLVNSEIDDVLCETYGFCK